jgi:hypothetical protein
MSFCIYNSRFWEVLGEGGVGRVSLFPQTPEERSNLCNKFQTSISHVLGWFVSKGLLAHKALCKHYEKSLCCVLHQSQFIGENQNICFQAADTSQLGREKTDMLEYDQPVTCSYLHICDTFLHKATRLFWSLCAHTVCHVSEFLRLNMTVCKFILLLKHRVMKAYGGGCKVLHIHVMSALDGGE